MILIKRTNKDNKSIKFFNGTNPFKKRLNPKMNKKAWVRIVEATIASLILIGFILVMMSRQQTKTTNIGEDVYEKQMSILDVIGKNENLRNKILTNDERSIKIEIEKRVPSSWNFTVNICNLDEVCSGDIPYDREVYSAEKVITSTSTKYDPKKLRFFVWIR